MSNDSEIICRRDARLMVEMFDEEVAKLPESLKATFWEAARAQVLLRCPMPASTEKAKQPMDDSEAIRFESTPMPWGQFSGIPVGVVHGNNPDYLHWAIQPDEFKVNLIRYLRSERAARYERETS